MMKTSRGRLNSLPALFKNYKEHTLTIQLTKERIILFEDGTMKRFKRQVREIRRR